MFVGTLGESMNQQEFEMAMERKIYSYKSSDRKAGRAWVEETYVTTAGIKDLLEAQRGRCVWCGCVLQQRWVKGDHEQLSVDRIDNDKAHVLDNCQLLCLKCNKVKQ